MRRTEDGRAGGSRTGGHHLHSSVRFRVAFYRSLSLQNKRTNQINRFLEARGRIRSGFVSCLQIHTEKEMQIEVVNAVKPFLESLDLHGGATLAWRLPDVVLRPS